MDEQKAVFTVELPLQPLCSSFVQEDVSESNIHIFFDLHVNSVFSLPVNPVYSRQQKAN